MQNGRTGGPRKMIYLRTRLFGSISMRMTNATMTMRCNEVGSEALKTAVIAAVAAANAVAAVAAKAEVFCSRAAGSARRQIIAVAYHFSLHSAPSAVSPMSNDELQAEERHFALAEAETQ